MNNRSTSPQTSPITDGAQRPESGSTYRPGDVVNGHRLGEDNAWRPLDPSDRTPAAATATTTKGGAAGWVGRHKVLSGIGAAVLLLTFVGVATVGGGSDTTAKTAIAVTSPAATSTPAAEQESATQTSKQTTPPAPVNAKSKAPTKAQENALRSAKSYLKFKGFSKKGLTRQLTSEYGSGYEKADAEWAINKLDVDWNEQAVRAAESYLDFKGFSRKGLIQQLSSEYGSQFTVKQATYAADKVGL